MGYQFSYDKVLGHTFGDKVLNWDVKKILKKIFLDLSSIFKSAKSPATLKKKRLVLKICWTSWPDVISCPV